MFDFYCVISVMCDWSIFLFFLLVVCVVCFMSFFICCFVFFFVFSCLICAVGAFFFFFFFSSRRRHTRCLSDWSSDVCSSDLKLGGFDVEESRRIGRYFGQHTRRGRILCLQRRRGQPCQHQSKCRCQRTHQDRKSVV